MTPPDPPPGAVYWLEQALDAEPGPPARPPLAGTERVDVCIVGGGYTGLWAALELRELAPDASVAIVEAESCGFGASGRNGGWVTSWYDELDGLARHFGAETAVALADQTSATIDRIEAFTAEHGIDCHLRRRGSLYVASTPGQVDAIDSAVAAAVELGRGDRIEVLDADRIAELTGTRVATHGVLVRDSACVQPALLARGLRRVAIEKGVKLFEGTPMLRLDRGQAPVVATTAGRIEAGRVILATGAWSARVRELRRAVAVVGTQIVLTEPIAERLERFDWSKGALLGDARLFVHYAQVTTGGRIAFGRGGGAIGPFGKVIPKHFADPRTTREVAADFRKWFPGLADVRLTHAWGGPVDRAPGHLPFVGTLGDHGTVEYGVGYSGNGVGPSALIGRILARRALGKSDEYTGSPLTGGPPGYLPPEPLRFGGGVLVREAVARGEAREEEGGEPSALSKVARRLVHFSTRF